MTTIAYRDGVLAADSQFTAGGVHRGEARKVSYYDDYVYGKRVRTLIGLSGSAALCQAVMEWFKSGMPPESKPKAEEDQTLTALTVREGFNPVIWDKHLGQQTLKTEFVALGAGNEIAFGAMGAGASAEEAVKIACRYCIYSSEPVHTVSLTD